MRVCHVIHSFGVGGAEQVLVDLAHVAADAGLDLSVVSLMDPADRANWRRLEELGVTVETLGLASRWDPRAFPRARALIGELRPDVLHTHLKHADLVGAVVARRLGLPLVSTLHLIEDSVSVVGGAKRWLAGQARRRMADRTIAVSDAQRRWYLQRFPADPGRVVTLYNGVVPAPPLGSAERRALRASLGSDDRALLVVNVAIMRRGKGHDDLLAAAGMLPPESPVQVVLVGDGPERRRLEQAAEADERVRSRVRFAGYRDDVPRLLQTADLVVHPSHADALPTALIHALGAGVPVLATDVGGIPEIVGDRAGVLLPAGEPSRLAAEIQRLALRPDDRRRMGTAGRRRFEEMFQAGRWAGRLCALYNEVLELRRRRAPSTAR